MTPANVIAAGLAFAQASRVEDEFFALSFDDAVHDDMCVDSPFTHEAAVLGRALRQAHGGEDRALYDAIIHGLDYAARGRLEHRVLIVISGVGNDTASRSTFAQLLDRARSSPTTIYTITSGNEDEDDGVQPEALQRLAALTGGEAFFAKASSDLPRILKWIARDVRATYTLAYAPPNSENGARFRKLMVVLPHDLKAKVRYREGYAGGGL
jgi:VWFA-related protein